uniref:Uncharacterized protein n=1 Tax=Setaria italica TaxID=4555 RepID=K3YBM7_SETIT
MYASGSIFLHRISKSLTTRVELKGSSVAAKVVIRKKRRRIGLSEVVIKGAIY